MPFQLRLFLIPALTTTIVLSACSVGRNVPEGKTYFKNQYIEINDDSTEVNISKDELKSLTKIKPNRRILWMRINLRIHTWLVPQEALERSEIRIDERCPKKNTRRLSKGKTVKECQSLWTWLAYTVGEPPVILDSAEVKRSANQMEIYLQKKGYFKAEVHPEIEYTDSVLFYWRKRNKASVYYQVNPGKPYTIRNIQYIIEDPVMAERLFDFKDGSYIQQGSQFDEATFDAERQRITDYYTENGYYEFTKDYIVYNADTTVGNRQVDVKMILRLPQISSNNASGTSLLHRRFVIGNVSFNTHYNPLRPLDIPKNSDRFGDIQILYDSIPDLRPELLNYTNSIYSGSLYMKSRIDQTYRRLANLGTTRSVIIQMNPRSEVDSLGRNYLDVQVQLAPARKQSLSFDPRLTNRSGNMGIYANLAYSHRNLFRGAEHLRFSLITGVEASQPLGSTQVTTGTNEQLERTFNLNTFEIGPELSLSVPRLFPFGYKISKKSSAPHAALTAVFNYQKRPDYERTLTQLAYGWEFIENPNTVTKINIQVPEVSLIKIQNSPGFQELIERFNDSFLANSYQDHFIVAGRVVYTLNTQKKNFQRTYFYYRSSLEGAGNILRGLFKASNATLDDFGSYEIEGIRFAQYIKTEHDGRLYVNVNEKNTFVLRAFGGVGQPLKNLNVLPFEKSFFSGGANGIRAWQARTLGPGSFRDTSAVRTFNNIGDIKLEFNFEYRFKITKMFQAAFFADAGNIWLISTDQNRPGAEFAINRFIDEIAIGAGLGLRLDFDFFLVRLDMGVQLKDPLKVQGERWTWQAKDEYEAFIQEVNNDPYLTYRNRPVFNLGIGFPF